VRAPQLDLIEACSQLSRGVGGVKVGIDAGRATSLCRSRIIRDGLAGAPHLLRLWQLALFNPMDGTARDPKVAPAAIVVPQGRTKRDSGAFSLYRPVGTVVGMQVYGEPMSPSTGTIQNRPERSPVSLNKINDCSGFFRNIADSFDNAKAIKSMAPEKAWRDAGKKSGDTFLHGSISLPKSDPVADQYRRDPNCFDQRNCTRTERALSFG